MLCYARTKQYIQLDSTRKLSYIPREDLVKLLLSPCSVGRCIHYPDWFHMHFTVVHRITTQ